MKIGVIGTINRDSIEFPDGRKKEGWGGLLYNIITLSHLAGKSDSIIPVCNVGRDCCKEIVAILRNLPGICTDYVREVPEKNNHCFLTYLDDENKEEILRGGVKPLQFEDVTPLLPCDIILMNYISGRDIYLASLKKLRRRFGGTIYTDLHSLTLGKKKDGSRFLRIPPGWPAVVHLSDFIQMNRLELFLLSGQSLSDDRDKRFLITALEKLTGILRLNTIHVERKVFVITDGADGCHLFYPGRCGPVYRHIVAPDKIIQSDATGCGDCFSAGFVVALAGDRSLTECAIFANRAAFARVGRHAEIYSIIDR